ncbi:hypothetical protein GDO78_021865 [Eleutherodactylus coqui]|uniref:Uncharacterized protein n=1 Tax=Eleutherodactylus coqui TaxID=57060 RepID=A0A8J6B8P6_ELECQ|nr:hypothetical protein GDO78_021865 [Eleutherodactylus coqui]
MDWSSGASNGTLTYPNSQQYLPQSTSSTLSTIPSQTTSIAPNSYSATRVVVSSRNPILTGLLGAESSEQFFKIQQSLTKTPGQQTTQISPEQYNSLYSLQLMSFGANQSSPDIQAVVSNYQMQVYPNPLLQTFQQAQPVTFVQQQAQPVTFVQQQAQPVTLVQQQATHVQQQAQQATHVQQQAQQATHVQQQAQQATHVQQQAQQATHVQQQAQPVPHVQQQAAHVQQQAQPATHVQQSAPHVQQQAQPVPHVQQQAQPVPHVQQQAQPVPHVQQQAQPVPHVQQQATHVQQKAQPVQCYSNTGYNVGKVQQSVQSTQTDGYTHKRTHQRMSKTHAAKRPSQNVQVPYRPLMLQTNNINMNATSNRSSAPSVASYKTLNDRNVTSNYQSGQNIDNRIGSNYPTISHTNTLQPQQGVNDNVHNPQRQTISNLHSGFANNSCNVLPTTTIGQPPPSYHQSNTNASNVSNISVNCRFSNPNQNFGAQNAQQPAQSYTLPQDQHSMALLPSTSSRNLPQDQRHNVQDILALLKVYRDVKLKYLLLNRENYLFRQKMQSASQDNCSVRPPLISSLQNTTVPTNDFMSGQVSSQNSTAESQPPSNTTHLVQNATLYDNSLNVPVQNITQPSNSFPSQIYPTNDNVRNQTNYTGFDGDQMHFGSRANSTDKVSELEALRVQDNLVTSVAPKPINNQYLSNGHCSNVNQSQDVLHITSDQNLVQTNTASSERCSPSHTTNTGNVYASKPLSSRSREAINASLPLWKSVPQSSVTNKSGYSEPKPMVANGLNTVHRIADISSSSINEPTSVTLTQKSEHSGPNVSKGIAIVSPLVKIKDLVKDFNQHPKVLPLMKDLDNDHANGVEEKTKFKKLFLELDSVDDAVATMKNLDANSPRSDMVSSLPCSVEVSSDCNVDQGSTKNLENVDNLQISGICTLVEGNSLYDSSVAMMFEGSLQTPLGSLLTKTEMKDDHTLQFSQKDINLRSVSQATSGVSPTTETGSVEGPQEDIEPCIQTEDYQHDSVSCLEKQPEQYLLDSDAFDLESNTASDQLSELLTEFPFGIKNYMSKNELKSPGASLEMFADKPEIPKTLVPILCDGEIDGSIEDTWRKNVLDTTNIETQSQNTEVAIQQPTAEVAPRPGLPAGKVTSVQLEDDCFEISDSPDSNICITLLDQDEIPKLFPEDSAELVESEESVAESFAKTPVVDVAVDVAVSSIKEKTCNETLPAPEKELFCCLFSWLTHTNGNAPKCNCKMTEFGETKDLASKLSQHPAMSKTEASGAVLDSTTDGLEPLPNSCTIVKIQPPIKRPKLEPIDNSLESKLGPCIVDRVPQEIKLKLDLSGKYLKDQLQKELSKNDPSVNEKIFQSKSLLKDPSSKETKDPSSSYNSKVDASGKSEKLIVKTDFLKHKHLLKIKTKSKEKSSHVEEGSARSVKKIKKNKVGDSWKIVSMDQTTGSKTKNEKYKLLAGIVQQSAKSKTKLKSSSTSDKSHSHSQDPSPSKHRGRAKSIPQSHFEKVRKVPTVQEYLERKREMCNKKSAPAVDQKDEPVDIRHRVVEKPEMERSGNLQARLPKLVPPVKINVKTKNIESETINPNQKSRSRSSGGYESSHKRHLGSSSSHGKGSLVSQGQDQKRNSSKVKIYLTPLDGSQGASCEGISLTKLQIRCSPEKPEYSERRKSLDSSRHSKPSKTEMKNREAPKMLEFKLCPEFVHRSPSTQEKKREPKPAKEKNLIEGKCQ